MNNGLVRFSVLTFLFINLSIPTQIEAAGETVVYQNDFERGVGGEWSHPKTEVAPSGKQTFLGQFANDKVTLSLSDLPAHSEIIIELDLYIIQSMDGNDSYWGPDMWCLSLDDGTILLNTTFSNVTVNQAFPDNYPQGDHPPRTGAVDKDILGYTFMGDSIYKLSYRLAHAKQSLIMQFTGSGMLQSNTGGWTIANDEGWAIDNVEIRVVSSMEPTALPWTPTPFSTNTPIPADTPALQTPSSVPTIPSNEMVQLFVDAPSVKGEIHEVFGKNWYYFKTLTAGNYIIEAFPETNQPLAYTLVFLLDSPDAVEEIGMEIFSLEVELAANRYYYIVVEGNDEGSYWIGIRTSDQTPTSTPTPTFSIPNSTPTSPVQLPTVAPTISNEVKPHLVYEFDQSTLIANEWRDIPGGFTGSHPGLILPIGLVSGIIPSSKDKKGLAFSVRTGEVAFIHTITPVHTNGLPVLLRMVAQSDNPQASIALAALRGNLSTAEMVDGSIATLVPQSAVMFLNQEKQITLIYEPDQGDLFTPIIQVASVQLPNETGTVTVYVDRLEIFLLYPDLPFLGSMFGSKP